MLMLFGELNAAFATRFSPATWAPATPAHLAFGALLTKQRLGLTDEKIVDQLRNDPTKRFFSGFAAYSSKTPFDP
jgi:IS5 family transposase